MKKKILLLAVASILVMCLAACGGENSPNSKNVSDKSSPSSSAEENKSQDANDRVDHEITYQNVVTYQDMIGFTWVQVIVEIENTGNSNLYLNSGSYDLEDKDGALVTSKKRVSCYPNVLAPGEKGYMYDETILQDYEGDGNLVLNARPSVDKAKRDLIRYNITDVTVSDDLLGLKVMGRIENTTKETVEDMIYIVAFFYDGNNALIGSAFTILTEDLEAGAKIGFELIGSTLPDNVTADAISETVVYAYPFQMQF